MGWEDVYKQTLKKELEQKASNKSTSPSTSKKTTTGSSNKKKKKSYMDTYESILANELVDRDVSFDNNLTPVSNRVTSRMTTTNSEDKKRTWFQKGLFEDGYDFGDVTRTILGTATDVVENLGSGIMGLGEATVDTLAYLAPFAENAQFYQNGGGYNPELQKQHEKMVEQSKKDLGKFIAKDFVDEEAVARAIISDPARMVGVDSEAHSVFGEKSDSVIQSGGQLAAQLGLQAVGVPWWVTSGVSAFGSEAENAMNEGATYEEAGVSGAITASAEILTEKLSGGIKFGGKTVDDLLTKQIARGISNKYLRTAAKLGLDVVGEGAEEWISEDIGRFGQWLTYRDEEELKELLFSEEAMDAKIEAFIGGAALGGFSGTVKAVKDTKKGTDYASQMTANEQKVVDKIIKDMVAEESKKGEVSKKRKNEIYDQVVEGMEKGDISIDTIEEILGGETYKTYKDAVDKETGVLKEFSELYKGEELNQQINDFLENAESKKIKQQLRDEVLNMVKGDRLVESYNERARRGQKYEADVTQYDEKQRAVVQKAIDSGVLNNTRRSHEFVDLIAKLSADKGVSFDFVNNEKLKGSIYAVEGKTVNGFVAEDGSVTLNMDSKKSLNSVAGHEITHVLEGTELYDALQDFAFEYAKTKKSSDSKFDNEYMERLYNTRLLYKNVKGYQGVEGFNKIKQEVVADLVGDYLFTDADFVKNLSAKNKNVFQKMFDEIKYLCKVATAGSKEQKALLEVKRAFEEAYRADSKAESGTVKHSISDSNGRQLTKEQQEYFKDSKVRDENGNLKVMYHGSQDAGFHVFDSKFSDDDMSFFFVDSNDVAASYSGTTETYEAKTIRTADDMRNFLQSIGYEGYEVFEEGENHWIEQDGDYVAGGKTWQELYDEFCWYEGIGEGDANYKVYLNLKNPLEVDAQGRNWNRVGREFSQELYDKYMTLTDAEKEALVDATKWEDFGAFRDEVTEAVEAASNPARYGGHVDDYSKAIASAVNKLRNSKGELDMYTLHYFATENFAEDVIREDATVWLKTRDYAQKAKAEGYDGVIFKNIVDLGQYGGDRTPATVAIAFDSNQIKSVANAKPTADPDIRYSISDSNGRQLTKEQQEYFKDSKVRDENGSLQVMYHGSPESFTVFDKKKAKSSGLYGRGFYFTNSDSHAKQYGNTYEVYLNITNPLQNGTNDITKDQLRKFVEAIAEDEDYGIENYGYEATVDSVTNNVFGKGDFAMLMDINVTCVGNMVEAIELFNKVNGTGYNGIIAPTETVAFYPEQIKEVVNKKPTADKDIRFSLSESSDVPQSYGNYNIYGKDVAYDPTIEDIAPVRTDAKAETKVAISKEETTTDGIAPTKEEDTAPVGTVSNTENVDAPVDVANSPVLKRLNQKLTNTQTELANNEKLREESARSFDEKIAEAKAQLDAKKNKDTKVANNLKRRIERLERLKADRDAEYAKRIGSIKSRVNNIETDIQKYHPGLDRAEKAIARIDKILESDKAVLMEEYNQKKEQLADKDSYISQKATELYNEIRKLKKGVRASEQLGYLLDHGYEWSAIKSALINIKHTPGGTVNINSEAESVAREMLNDDYENSQYTLEEEYLKKIDELESKADEKRKAASVANQRKMKMEEHSKLWERLIGDTSTWKDMSLGLSYKTKTLRRILRKVVKDASGNADIQKADAIYDELETKYDRNEAQLKRESQKLKEVFFELGLNHAEDTYAHMLGELRHNPETTLTEEVVKEYYDAHKDKINTDKVNKAISEARKTFDNLLIRVNEVLREQGMKEIPYRKGYFPHFTNPKQGWLAKLLNWKTIDNEIPTSIAGLTEEFTPQRSWQPFNKQRMGDKTDYSLYQGLDTYIHGALDWIYHIDDLQSRRALENYLRYTHSKEGVKAKIDEIKANDSYDAEETQKMIEAVLDEANNPLNGLVIELRNRTNTLANKKSSLDRALEEKTNRKIYSTMTNLNNRITANQVVGSFSSALTNFIPMVQSWHQVSPYFTVRGLGDFVRSTVKDDGIVAKSDYLTNRLMEEEKLYQTGWDKVSDKAAFMMNVVDNITSQTVWRSKYLQNIKEGMSESQAIKDADQFAKNLMAGRSRGNAPTIFDAKNPFVKIFTAFQLEVANQYGYMLEDVPQDSKSKTRLVKGYATAFLGAYMYNALYSSLVGRDAAFDPIAIVEDLLKDLFDDEEEPKDIIMNLANNVIEEVPFVGGLIGGGRIPMSSAFPYSGYTNPFESMLTDVSEGNGKNFGKELLKPLYYLAMPVAGGQIKKTVEGLSMFSDDHPIAGSYTASGNLRFPVEKTIGNVVQAGLFGQYASKSARKYFDEEQRTLNPEQTAIFAELDIPIEEYWEYRDSLYEFYDVKDALAETAKADGATVEDALKSKYINAVYSDIYKLYDQQKELLDSNIYGNRKGSKMRDIQDEMASMIESSMNDYNDVYVNGKYATVGSKRFDYSDSSKQWYEIKDKYLEKEQEVTKELGITPEQYWNNKDEYTYQYNNPEKYQVARVAGGYKAFVEYTSDLWDIKADKDKNGKSINGSRKKKVIEYIDNLDADYGEKIILFKSEYNADDTYNYEIIDYLNGRDDISRDEMKTILEELGFKVDSNGYITW